MSDTPDAGLFPLPLVPFEWYMLADDSPDYPMAFTFRMQLSGRIRREEFEAALEEALGRHPLLCALVDRSVRRRPCWVPSGRLRPQLDWRRQGTPLACPRGKMIDLTSEVGLRIWVRQGTDAAEVIMQFHHSCCDGVGALGFMGDLLAAYGIRTATDDEKPELRPLDGKRLLARGRFGRRSVSPAGRVGGIWGTLREGAKWLGRHPTPLHPPDAAGTARPAIEPFPEIHSSTLDEAELRSLRSAARQHGATLNDLLLRDMFQTIHDWNVRHESSRRGRRLRISMPANLRAPGDDRMPAANVVTMSFLTRSYAECADPQGLLDGIRQETDSIKRSRRGLHFIAGMKVALTVCGGLPKSIGKRHCFATVVLSNLGDISKRFTAEFPRRSGRIVAGDLVLTALNGAPPVRPNTHAAFLISTYCGRATVSVRCDPHVFTPDHARELLGLYMARLRTTRQEGD